eukprot:scaffold9114_cov118-Isochrysis_galbana.AAC.7
MAPRQLLMELEEVDIAAEKGSKRVRADRADESSTQSSGSGTGLGCDLKSNLIWMLDVFRASPGGGRGLLVSGRLKRDYISVAVLGDCVPRC